MSHVLLSLVLLGARSLLSSLVFLVSVWACVVRSTLLVISAYSLGVYVEAVLLVTVLPVLGAALLMLMSDRWLSSRYFDQAWPTCRPATM